MRVTQMTKLLPNATIVDLTENVLTQTSSLYTKKGKAYGYITITHRVDDEDSDTEESTASQSRSRSDTEENSELSNKKSIGYGQIGSEMDIGTLNKNNKEIARHIRIKEDVNNRTVPVPIDIVNVGSSGVNSENQITNEQTCRKRPDSHVIYPFQFVWCGKKFLRDDWELYKYNLMALQYIERYPSNEALVIYAALQGFQNYNNTENLLNCVYKKLGNDPTWDEFKNEIDHELRKSSANRYTAFWTNKKNNKNTDSYHKPKKVESARCEICKNPNHKTKSCNSAIKNSWRMVKCDICNTKGHASSNCPVEKVSGEVLTGIAGLMKLGDDEWWKNSDKHPGK